MDMDKTLRNTEAVIVAVMLLLGVASIVGGIMTGMWHCFLISGMTLVLAYAWYNEEYKGKRKSLWRKKTTKN